MTRRVTMHEAPGAIRAAVEGSSPAVVAIAGPVGSGKSTLARMLSACVISTDDYLPDYELIPEPERDEPRHADIDLLVENLAALRAGRPARVPVWSFQTHSRRGYRELLPAPLIVLEGIHALHEPVLPSLDLGVFVDAPRDTRWKRWEILESSGQRGWGVDKARAFFHAVAEPTFERYAAVYRARAGVVVVNDAGLP